MWVLLLLLIIGYGEFVLLAVDAPHRIIRVRALWLIMVTLITFLGFASPHEYEYEESQQPYQNEAKGDSDSQANFAA